MLSKLLQQYNIILGSASPRRKELLSDIGLNFTIQTTDKEENYPSILKENKIAEFLAKQKTEFLSENLSKTDLLITADTIVSFKGELLNKPKNKKEALKKYLQHFKVRTVLTAHPTQFYPGSVLGIITDLAKAIEKNQIEQIKLLLAQLGKTPFFKKTKPTPYDEAVSLIWYLENVFYQSVSTIYDYIQNNIFEGESLQNQVINLGFWPGGDRDGNPYVTTETTLQVAERLRQTILKNYHKI